MVRPVTSMALRNSCRQQRSTLHHCGYHPVSLHLLRNLPLKLRFQDKNTSRLEKDTYGNRQVLNCWWT